MMATPPHQRPNHHGISRIADAPIHERLRTRARTRGARHPRALHRTPSANWLHQPRRPRPRPAKPRGQHHPHLASAHPRRSLATDRAPRRHGTAQIRRRKAADPIPLIAREDSTAPRRRANARPPAESEKPRLPLRLLLQPPDDCAARGGALRGPYVGDRTPRTGHPPWATPSPPARGPCSTSPSPGAARRPRGEYGRPPRPGAPATTGCGAPHQLPSPPRRLHLARLGPCARVRPAGTEGGARGGRDTL